MGSIGRTSPGASVSVVAVLVLVVTAAVAVGVIELTSAIPGAPAPSTSFTSSTALSSSNVTPSSGNLPLKDYCGSPVFPLRGQQENGSIFLKIVTSLGSIVNNGSV